MISRIIYGSWSYKIKLISVEKHFLLPLGFISIRSTADIFGLICLVSSVFQILINVFAFWPYVIFSNNNKIPRTPNNYWLSSGSNTWEATIYLEFIFGITWVIFVKYIIGIACACTSFCPTKLNLKRTQYCFRLRWKGWEIMVRQNKYVNRKEFSWELWYCTKCIV